MITLKRMTKLKNKSPARNVKIFPTSNDSTETLKLELVLIKMRPIANAIDVTIPIETSP